MNRGQHALHGPESVEAYSSQAVEALQSQLCELETSPRSLHQLSLKCFSPAPEKQEISAAEGNKQMDRVIYFEGNSVLFELK